jgi:hypothetical protein
MVQQTLCCSMLLMFQRSQLLFISGMKLIQNCTAKETEKLSHIISTFVRASEAKFLEHGKHGAVSGDCPKPSGLGTWRFDW